MQNLMSNGEQKRATGEAGDLTASQICLLKKKLEEELFQVVERVKFSEITGPEQTADVVDRATLEEERGLQAAAIGRLDMRMGDIKAALRKIEEGDYGYCEDTGEPIGFDRLLINPACRLSFFAQEKRERLGRQKRQ